MRINHNIAALNTHRQLNTASTAQSKSMEKLSSGLRINKAGDDAAGLAISEKMRGQIRGLDMAAKNAQDGISMIQTAEGALNETHDILQRMRELAVQSSNDTNTDKDREELQKEVDQLAEEITRIANNTEFNTKSLLNGAVDENGESTATFHIGANAGQNLSLSIKAMDAKTLGVSGDTVKATTTSVGGNVDSVTYNNDNLGAKVVDGATISLNYTAATGPSNAVAGDYTITLGTDDVTIDGTVFTYSGTASVTGEWNDAAELATLINNDATLSAKYTASDDGGALKLVQNAGEESSTAPTVTGTGASINTTQAGSEASLGNAAKVTISDGATTQDITIADTTATSLSVTTGNYSGLTFDFGTNTIADLGTTGTTDQVVVGLETESASSATFANGEKTADAVAKAGINISSQSAANSAITVINDAIETVSAERSKLGAYQNRLEHTINNLNTSSENLTAAESRVRDVDMAKEMMEQTKNSILSQAAQAMLAQSNQMPQGVLQLLR
ncbi:flagellin [Solibacillus sp. FSL R5-0691]|uniref:flagellin N-terminal helical domain-containing protein n=1 Tax=Solibacillus sp. FSL R5-0691 TaxID=2921653 RepID=UPI0030CE7AE5